ncbi:hypothetical protein SteCoe_20996 [Stentor coeruleus]|uniref:Uncharacterized protein n=1 Tax=Stentor coeruleus TaxID=5963 RepID=A0A1R2BQL3_9CILI|nr:hypothetical protein SteCoe_20996 [Stentor coeruleus]
MYKSRSNDQVNNKKHQSLFVNALGPKTRYNPHKDPFEALTIKSSAKLMPVSPSGIHLPKIGYRSSVCSPKNALASPPLSVRSPKNEKIFSFVQVKSETTPSLTPKTPIFNLKLRCLPVYNKKTPNRNAKPTENTFLDVSFGNNS